MNKFVCMCLCVVMVSVLLTGCGSSIVRTDEDIQGSTAEKESEAAEKEAGAEDSGDTAEVETLSVEPLDPVQYLLPADAFKTDALLAFENTDILNGHKTSEFVKEGPYSIGVSFQDLTNPVWAGIAKYIEEFGKEHDMNFTIADCGGDAATQVSQLENYIESGVDGIFIGGVDSESLKDVTAKALDAGIPVMGIALQFGYGNCILYPPDYQAGTACGEAAAVWINEKFDGKCQVAVLDYPQEICLLDRGNAIQEAIKANSPEAEIVAVKAAINVSEGYDATESILQAYPDVKVICTIGDGGALGASEAVVAAGKNTDDFGIFGIDGTDDAVMAINDMKNPYRSSISFGNAIGWARYAVDNFVKIFNGEEYNLLEAMPVIPVNNDNLLSYAEYSGIDLNTLK